MFKAQSLTRKYHNPNEIQASTLLSIKTGGCPEDCKYCPQSARYNTNVKADKLMDKESVITAAKNAKESGATRFCMGAAWREPKSRDMSKITDIIKSVKELGLETCATLGMLSKEQAIELKQNGLDYYNHNIDTDPDFYKEVITTRNIDDRLQTINHVRDSGLNVCCGGIVGLGETVKNRAAMVMTLANMKQHPESVPINMLVKVEGTPFQVNEEVSALDFIRTIAVARITMPKSFVRLSAGREKMSEETQALAFLAGANSIFYGEKLLTTPNPNENKDNALLNKLGMTTKKLETCN